MGRIPSYRDELDEAVCCIIVEPLGIGDRDDSVVVGREGHVLVGIEAFIATVCVDEAWCVQAVAAHHATDGSGSTAPLR